MSIDAFREQTGLSIRELADLIDVSHSSISHKEKGRRAFFPSKGEQKLDQLKQVWEQCCSGKTKLVVEKSNLRCRQQAYLSRLLEKHSRDATFDLLRLTLALEAMRERYQKLETKLLFIRLLQQDNEDKSRDIIFRFREHKLLKAIDFCSPEKQQLLSFRLELAKAKKKLVEDTIKAVGNGAI